MNVNTKSGRITITGSEQRWVEGAIEVCASLVKHAGDKDAATAREHLITILQRYCTAAEPETKG